MRCEPCDVRLPDFTYDVPSDTMPEITSTAVGVDRVRGVKIAADLGDVFSDACVDIYVPPVAEMDKDEMFMAATFQWTGPDVLREIYNVALEQDDEELLEWLTGHDYLPLDVMYALAAHPDEDVRRGVAYRPGTTPTDIFEALSRDVRSEVRLNIIANPNVPTDIVASMWETCSDRQYERKQLLERIEKDGLLRMMA